MILLIKKIHKLLDMCFHELKPNINKEELPECKYCGALFIQDWDFNIGFTLSWESFGILWEWWQRQDQYWKFITFLWDKDFLIRIAGAIALKYISPYSFAKITIEFFKEEIK